MARSEGQALKLLYIHDILLKQTNEDNPITVQQIIETLESRYGINAERKSIYKDIERLKEYGLDIATEKKGLLYIPESSKPFSYTEVRILIDMVRFSKAIPNKANKGGSDLIKRLEGFMTEEDIKRMNDNNLPFYQSNNKSHSDFYNIMKVIYSAINANCQIEFRYLVYNTRGEAVPKHEGNMVRVSPWMVVWNDGKCYLLGYSKKDNLIKTYRCDKIEAPKIVNEVREGRETAGKTITADYMDSHFSMFSGEKRKIEVVFENSLSNVVFDRFGKDVWACPYDDKHFKAVLNVAYSKQFLGWLMGLNGEFMLTGSNAKEILKDIKKMIPKVV